LLRFLGIAFAVCRRRFTVSAGVLICSGVAIVAVWMSCHRRSSLPNDLVVKLESHAAATAAETIAVSAAKREARADSIATVQSLARARPHRHTAQRSGARADSLARSRDWERAYEARSRQVGELLTIDALKDTALVAGGRRGAELSAALQLTEVRAARADALLGEVVQVARANNECGLGCRSRRAATIGAFIAGALLARSAFRRS